MHLSLKRTALSLLFLCLIPLGYTKIDTQFMALVAEVVASAGEDGTQPVAADALTARIDQYFASLRGQYFAEISTEDFALLIRYASLHVGAQGAQVGDGVRSYLREVYRTGDSAVRAQFEAQHLRILQGETTTAARVYVFDTLADDLMASVNDRGATPLRVANAEFHQPIFVEFYKDYKTHAASIDAAARALVAIFATQPHDEELVARIEKTFLQAPIESVKVIARNLLQLAQSHPTLPAGLQPSRIIIAHAMPQFPQLPIAPPEDQPNSYGDVLFRNELIFFLVTRSVGTDGPTVDLLQHLIVGAPQAQVDLIAAQTRPLLNQIARNNTPFKLACGAALRLKAGVPFEP